MNIKQTTNSNSNFLLEINRVGSLALTSERVNQLR